MGERSGIEWTDDTWNPWHGCKRASRGCANCYAEKEWAPRTGFKKDFSKVERSKTQFDLPLRLDGKRLIFTCSLSDFFIEEADDWRGEAWRIISLTPHHTYQILTKRPERILHHLPQMHHLPTVFTITGIPDWPWKHVWLGTSVEDQEWAQKRIPHLVKVPASVRFLSCEPLLGPLDLRPWLADLHWVIVGGESGKEARPMEASWVKDIIRQCRERSVPVFVKQLGSVWAKTNRAKSRKGGDPDEWPEHLRIRETPGARA